VVTASTDARQPAPAAGHRTPFRWRPRTLGERRAGAQPVLLRRRPLIEALILLGAALALGALLITAARL
jgi:hypothetical protein